MGGLDVLDFGRDFVRNLFRECVVRIHRMGVASRESGRAWLAGVRDGLFRRRRFAGGKASLSEITILQDADWEEST
ncbi:hypothetical protein [Stappia sp. ES.058]|uniref:hypothetical protein n=1 Tax=Stappia sp. ES.058 TaxID=1881061 RepID=UPI0012FE07DC|nr:hypothetical protein [Stappia sp. ES.058]